MPDKVVTRIEAIPRIPSKYLYVGIYCRVRTRSQDQLHSLSNQTSHFVRLFSDRYYYRIRDVYIASGANTEGRCEYLKMLNDCRSHQIDIVVTKSLCRLGRDTVETHQAIRELKALNVQIMFEEENIDTDTTDSELVISLVEGIAQAENEATIRDGA